MLTASSGRHELAISAVGWRLRRVADWPLRTKLAMVLLTPTVVAVVLGATQVSAELALAGQAAELTGRVTVLDRATALAHGLQRELELVVVPGSARSALDAARVQVDGMAAVHVVAIPSQPVPMDAAGAFDLVFPVLVAGGLVIAGLLWALFTSGGPGSEGPATAAGPAAPVRPGPAGS